MKEKAVRTNISIPADLYRAMCKSLSHMNWSLIACEAFRQKLEEVDAEKRQELGYTCTQICGNF